MRKSKIRSVFCTVAAAYCLYGARGENEKSEVTFKYVIGSYWTGTSQTTFSTDPQYQIPPIFVVEYRSYPGGPMRLPIMVCA
jgi:hypothetical protein